LSKHYLNLSDTNKCDIFVTSTKLSKEHADDYDTLKKSGIKISAMNLDVNDKTSCLGMPSIKLINGQDKK